VNARRFACAALCCAFAGCGGGAPAGGGATPPAAPVATSAPQTPLPIDVNGTAHGGRPIRLTELKKGRVLYVLLTDALRGRYSGTGTGTSRLTNPRITFYQAGGKRLYAQAPAGTVVEKDKTIRMTGGVHAHSEDGTTLVSDSLRYDDVSEVVHGEGHVVITSPRGERLEGNVVDWNLHTGDIEMAR
jgi:LPS export ABC transporter protein LptC